MHFISKHPVAALLATATIIGLGAVGATGAYWTVKNVRSLSNEHYALRASYLDRTAKLQTSISSLQEALAVQRQVSAKSHTEIGGLQERLDVMAAVGMETMTLGSPELQTINAFDSRFLTGKPISRSYFFGPNAGNASVTGGDNLGVGEAALSSLVAGHTNTAIGNFAMKEHIGGTGNVAVGSHAMRESEKAIDVTAVGYEASRMARSGVGTSSFGRRACGQEDVARNSTCVGDSSLLRNQGIGNVGMGYRAAEYFKEGDYNVLLGAAVGLNRSSGEQNTIVGSHAWSAWSREPDIETGEGALPGGNRNVGMGYAALLKAQGSELVGIGHSALIDLEEGDGVVALGHAAGASISHSRNSIFIGSGSGASRPAMDNVIVIGAGALASQDRQVVIGDDEIESLVIGGVELTPNDLRQVLRLVRPIAPSAPAAPRG